MIMPKNGADMFTKVIPSGKKYILFSFLLTSALLFGSCGKRSAESAASSSIPVTDSNSDLSSPVITMPENTPPVTLSPLPSPSPTPLPTFTPTPSPLPEVLKDCEQAVLTSDSGALNSKLFDDNFMTFGTLTGGSHVKLTSNRPVDKLYIVWNDHPLSCSLYTSAGSIEIGSTGFMHELVCLPEATTSISLNAPSEDIGVCDIYAFTEGKLPDWVQDWEPPHETADILLFSTHSDDEFIFFGGIIPSYGKEKGYRVQLAYMTSPYIGSERYRCHELLNGLWTAGVTHYPVTTGARDWGQKTLEAAKNYYGYDNFMKFQVEQIRRFRPLVVLGHDLNGEYGHTVHMLGALTLKDAVPAAADSSKYPESAKLYGIWDTPKFYLHLYGKNPTVLDYETPLKAFGGKTAFQVAMESYSKHLSQQRWSFTVYTFGSPVDSHRFGLVRSLVGDDIKKKDLMENISPEAFR